MKPRDCWTQYTPRNWRKAKIYHRDSQSVVWVPWVLIYLAICCHPVEDYLIVLPFTIAPWFSEISLNGEPLLHETHWRIQILFNLYSFFSLQLNKIRNNLKKYSIVVDFDSLFTLSIIEQWFPNFLCCPLFVHKNIFFCFFLLHFRCLRSWLQYSLWRDFLHSDSIILKPVLQQQKAGPYCHGDGEQTPSCGGRRVSP